MTDDTRYEVVRNDVVPMERGRYEDDDDPYSGWVTGGYGTKRVLVTGKLADMVRKRADREGEVYITEEHTSTGYCYTCAGEDVDFAVDIDGEEVYRPDHWDAYGIERPEDLNSLAQFQAWLTGSDEEEN